MATDFFFNVFMLWAMTGFVAAFCGAVAYVTLAIINFLANRFNR